MKAEPIFLQCQVGFMCGSEKQGFRPRAEISFLGWVSHPLARWGVCYPEPGSRYHGTSNGPSQSSRIQRQGGSFQREPDCNLVCLGVIINSWLFLRDLFLREDQVRFMCWLFFLFLWDRVHGVPTVLDLPMQTRLASNSEIHLPLTSECWD